jgi:2-dehydro-3-deoxyphosphogluconate aldolase / (4S)-4-hydroxy-2-oxoglutarate aldolase
MSYTTIQIIETMRKTGLVPLFSHDDAQTSQEIVEAAYRGGVRVIEFTNRKENAFEVFIHLVKNRTRYPEMIVGIGTVMDAGTTKKFIDAGADFIVSPILKPEMAPVCIEAKRPWIPGCATLTEIMNARDLGAQVIKVFPGSVVGPGFVSSILPVVPNLNLMITGGVEPNEANLQAWFKAGSLCVGLGSHLFTSEIIQNKRLDKLESKIAEVLSIIQKVKSALTPRNG